MTVIIVDANKKGFTYASNENIPLAVDWDAIFCEGRTVLSSDTLPMLMSDCEKSAKVLALLACLDNQGKGNED